MLRWPRSSNTISSAPLTRAWRAPGTSASLRDQITGEPVYSLTVTLFSLLVSTGLGSLLLARRLASTGRHTLLVPCGILVYVALNAALHQTARLQAAFGLLFAIGLLF